MGGLNSTASDQLSEQFCPPHWNPQTACKDRDQHRPTFEAEVIVCVAIVAAVVLYYLVQRPGERLWAVLMHRMCPSLMRASKDGKTGASSPAGRDDGGGNDDEGELRKPLLDNQ